MTDPPVGVDLEEPILLFSVSHYLGMLYMA